MPSVTRSKNIAISLAPQPPFSLLSFKKRQYSQKVYLVLDAFDQWRAEADDLSLVSELEKLGPNDSILIMSRPLPLREGVLHGKVRMEIYPLKADLEMYVRSRLETQSWRGFLKHDHALKNAIQCTILEKCEGL